MLALDCIESLAIAPSPEGVPCCLPQRAGFKEAKNDVVFDVAPPSLNLNEDPKKNNELKYCRFFLSIHFYLNTDHEYGDDGGMRACQRALLDDDGDYYQYL